MTADIKHPEVSDQFDNLRVSVDIASTRAAKFLLTGATKLQLSKFPRIEKSEMETIVNELFCNG